MRALLAFLLVSCAETKLAAGYVGGTAAEYIACPLDIIDCGHVFLCATPADNALGLVEICVDDDNGDRPDEFALAEEMYGECKPTPRHQGLCLYCPEERGCNAFSGCFNCPEE